MEKFKNVPTLSGLVSFSKTLAHGVRAPVPRDPRAEQRSEGRRNDQGEGRSEDLTLPEAETHPEETRRSGASLRAAEVSRSFDGVQALRGVTLELHRHEVVGLIGPNGAGKSTLVNVLTGFDFPDEGTVELEGRDITRWRPHRRGRAGLARTFQHSRSFRSLSVRENVEVAALGVGAGPREARRRAGEPTRVVAPRVVRGCSGGLARARGRAASRRRPCPRDDAAVRPHGRARRGIAGGRSAGFRRGRAFGSRRARRGRAPHRSQHGADHGRVRSHPGARPGDDSGGGIADARFEATWTWPPRTWAKAPCARRLMSEGTARARDVEVAYGGVAAVRGLSLDGSAQERSSG